MRAWRNPFKKATATFIKVVGDLPMEQVGRAEALQLRDHFRRRVESGETVPYSANREISSLITLFKEIPAEKQIDLDNPFAGLRLREAKVQGQRKALPDAVIRQIIAPDALKGMNEEARDIVYICINTGCRPSEVCGVLPHHVHLDANVPHFDLTEEGRALKTGASIRKVVLVGIALETMR